jgi:uncharacterized protein (TIGR03067 family)
MSDLEKLQGLWRVQSSYSNRRPVGEAASHYLVSGDSMKEIVPNFVSYGKLRTTIKIDESVSPKRLEKTLDYNGPDGPPDPNPIILRYLYRLEGDTLVLCSGPGREFPETISEEYSIKTLVRDYGPVPDEQQPSGTPPLVDDLLGTLAWDDNLHWYGGRLTVAGVKFELYVSPADGHDVSVSLSRARQVIAEFDRYRRQVADYAVDGLLDTKNDVWLEEDEKPLSPEEFKAKMTLESVSVDSDGALSFYHRDGGLFWGHSIEVCLDAKDNCKSTDIPG